MMMAAPTTSISAATSMAALEETVQENYPPWIMIGITLLTDQFCYSVAGCPNWQEYLPFGLGSEGGWLGLKLPYMHECYQISPQLLSFADFMKQQREEEGGGNDKTFLQSFYTYLFKTSNTSLMELTSREGLVILTCLILLFSTLKIILQPVFSSWGRSIGRRTHGVQWERDNEDRMFKFGEYGFRLVWHTFIALYGWNFTWEKEWWTYDTNTTSGGTKELFLNWGYHTIPPGLAWYFLLGATYHLESLIYLFAISFRIRLNTKTNKFSFFPLSICWSETARGDFREMFVHHNIANLMIFTSSFFRLHRVGSMVLFLHDASDITTDLSKLANFVKWKTTTALCFFSMVVMWFVTRLYFLPFVVVRAGIFEAHLGLLHLTKFFPIEQLLPMYYAMRGMFVCFFSMLISLQLYWFSMFIKMGYILLFRGETHDLTEHKKGEKQLHDGLKKSEPAVVKGI